MRLLARKRVNIFAVITCSVFILLSGGVMESHILGVRLKSGEVRFSFVADTFSIHIQATMVRL